MTVNAYAPQPNRTEDMLEWGMLIGGAGIGVFSIWDWADSVKDDRKMSHAETGMVVCGGVLGLFSILALVKKVKDHLDSKKVV